MTDPGQAVRPAAREQASREGFRPAVVVPTYNHGRPLPGVLRRVRRLGLPTFVVDDGSTDHTPRLLARWGAPGVVVLRHGSNRGKAAALLTGFRAARAAGCTHAVTIDADGQLEPEQIPELLAVARARPRDLVVGTRDPRSHGYPLRSRLGRAVSNALVLLECGRRVTDSQCGLRVYPLDLVRDIPCRTGRYGYETEILTRAAWAGRGIHEVPVRCRYLPKGARVTHLSPLRETLRAAGMHGRLLLEAPCRGGRRVRGGDEPSSPGRERLARSLGVGVFVACQPVYGLQTVLGLVLAWVLRLNPAAVVAGSLVSTPPVGFALIGAAVTLGHLLLHGRPSSPAELEAARAGWSALASRVALDWVVGGLAEGLALGLGTYVLVRGGPPGAPSGRWRHALRWPGDPRGREGGRLP